MVPQDTLVSGSVPPTLTPDLSSSRVHPSSQPQATVSCFSWADLSDSDAEEETFTELTETAVESSDSLKHAKETGLEFSRTGKSRRFRDCTPHHLSPLTSGTPSTSDAWSRELHSRAVSSRGHESGNAEQHDDRAVDIDQGDLSQQQRSDLCSSVCESFDLFGYASRSLPRSVPGRQAPYRNESDTLRDKFETTDAEVALLPLRERDSSRIDLRQVHKLWQSSRALLESNQRAQSFNRSRGAKDDDQGFSLYAAVANRVELEEVIDAAELASDAITHGGARIERPSRLGVSGAYLIRNVTGTQKVLGIFKPFDEETAGVELPLQSAELYFHPAEGAFKECAAYLLDHGHFANVPQTALARCRFVERCGDAQTRRTKCGAFQVYYRNRGDAEDFGPGVFDTEAVQRIAAFDIRVLQCDRNASNVLVCDTTELLRHRGYTKESQAAAHGLERAPNRNQMQLVAIDHAYILPEQVPTVPRACWMDWAQSHEAVVDSVRRYVFGLDSLADVKLLIRELGPRTLRQGSLRSLCIGTLLLKLGIDAGLTLYQIGLLVYGNAASTHSAESWQSTRAARSHHTQDSRLEEGCRSDQSRFENRSKLETIVLEAERVSLARERRLHFPDSEKRVVRRGSLYAPHREESDGVFAFEEQIQATASNAIHPSTDSFQTHPQLHRSRHVVGESVHGAIFRNRSWSFDDSNISLVAVCALESPYFYRYLSKRLACEIQALLLTAVEESPSKVTETPARRSDISIQQGLAPLSKMNTTGRISALRKENGVVSGLRRSVSVPNLTLQ